MIKSKSLFLHLINIFHILDYGIEGFWDMSIKPQDIVILAKLLAKSTDDNWSQNSIANELCLSPSQINSGFRRLVEAGFLMPYQSSEKTQPILQACEEFFIHGLK